jgi:hypothetical protein
MAPLGQARGAFVFPFQHTLPTRRGRGFRACQAQRRDGTEGRQTTCRATQQVGKGGRVWYDAEGLRVYVIRRQVNHKRYERSTHASSHRAALAQLGRFGADPANYDPRGEVRAPPIYLDAALRERFLRSSKEKGKRGYGNSADWVRNQGYHTLFWMEALGGVDLRKARRAEHILPALRGKATHAELPNYKQRVQVLKTLYGWLRTVEHVIGPTEDPTFGALTVPAARAAQLDKTKVGPLEDFRRPAVPARRRRLARYRARPLHGQRTIEPIPKGIKTALAPGSL